MSFFPLQSPFQVLSSLVRSYRASAKLKNQRKLFTHNKLQKFYLTYSISKLFKFLMLLLLIFSQEMKSSNLAYTYKLRVSDGGRANKTSQ